MQTDPFMQGLFPQLGLTPTESCNTNNGCGFKMTPDPAYGEGYLWTYPVNPYFSITIYHLKFYREMYYRYHHPAMLVISLSSPSVAKAVTDTNSNQKSSYLDIFCQTENTNKKYLPIVPLIMLALLLHLNFINRA